MIRRLLVAAAWSVLVVLVPAAASYATEEPTDEPTVIETTQPAQPTQTATPLEPAPTVTVTVPAEPIAPTTDDLCGTPDAPCAVMVEPNQEAWLLGGVGALVLLAATLVVSQWGRG